MLFVTALEIKTILTNKYCIEIYNMWALVGFLCGAIIKCNIGVKKILGFYILLNCEMIMVNALRPIGLSASTWYLLWLKRVLYMVKKKLGLLLQLFYLFYL